MSSLRLYVIIPTHNRKDRLALLLQSLSKARLPKELVQIIVVENGSRVASEMVATFSVNLPIRYEYLTDGNKSKALNAVIKLLPQDAFLLFFDDDVKVAPNTLTAFVNAAKQFGEGYYYGGALRSEYEEPPLSELVPYLPLSAKSFYPTPGETHVKSEKFISFLGANWACFSRDILEAGGFSKDFGPGSPTKARGQEANAQWRMYRNGVRPVGVAGTLVDHWVPKKVLTATWAIDRVFHSSILQGKEKSSIRYTIVFLGKALLNGILLLFGNRSISTRIRMANAIGYFKGLIS